MATIYIQNVNTNSYNLLVYNLKKWQLFINKKEITNYHCESRKPCVSCVTV